MLTLDGILAGYRILGYHFLSSFSRTFLLSSDLLFQIFFITVPLCPAYLVIFLNLFSSLQILSSALSSPLFKQSIKFFISVTDFPFLEFYLIYFQVYSFCFHKYSSYLFDSSILNSFNSFYPVVHLFDVFVCLLSLPHGWLFLCVFLISLLLAYLSVQFSSVAQSCPPLCDPMNRSTPGLPVHHQLPEFTETHVHRVGDPIQPSHPLSSPSPPAYL